MSMLNSEKSRVLNKNDWIIVSVLLGLSFIPTIAGVFRVVQIGTGAEITPENARFFAEPLPVVLHIVGSLMYCVLGAFQFSPGIRRRQPGWHRLSGRILVPMGFVAALSGVWMTLFYPPANFDGSIVYGSRLLVGIGMAAFLLLGLNAIRKRNVASHRIWMMRAYAIGIGAGTQVLTHIPWFVFPDIQGEFARAICMTAGWIINIVVAEWFIVRERRNPITTSTSTA